MRPNRRLAIPLVVCFFLVPAIATAQALSAPSVGLVSPGGPGAPTLTTECPTFSWAPGDSVSTYELAVFELTNGQPRTVPNVHVALSGRASTWTPPATTCLSAGHQYGWYMREIKRQGDKPGKWTDALSFTVTAGASSTSATGGTGANGGTVAAQAGGNGGGNGASNQAILDRLTAIEAQLTTLANPGFRQETCYELGAEGELGFDAEGKVHANLRGLLGAVVFGNGAEAGAKVETGVKIAGGVKGNLSIKRSGCWDPLILGGTQKASTATAGAAAASVSGDELKALAESVADQFQLTDDRIRSALTALPTFASGPADIWSSLKSDGPLSRLASVLPVPDDVRNLVNDPGQIIENFRAQLNLCGRSDLPPAITGLISEFCQLANAERFAPLLDRVDGVVQNVKSAVDTVKSGVDTTIANVNTVRTNVDGVRGVVNGINSTVNNIRGKVDDVYCFFFCLQQK